MRLVDCLLQSLDYWCRNPSFSETQAVIPLESKVRRIRSVFQKGITTRPTACQSITVAVTTRTLLLPSSEREATTNADGRANSQIRKQANRRDSGWHVGFDFTSGPLAFIRIRYELGSRINEKLTLHFFRVRQNESSVMVELRRQISAITCLHP